MVLDKVSQTLITIGLLVSSAHPSASSSTYLSTQPVLQQEVYHVVKNDESLGMIAEEAYGDSAYWTTLWNDNSWITDPGTIYSGWKLKIRGQKPLQVEEARQTSPRVVIASQIEPTPTITNTPISTVASVITPTPVERSYPQSTYDDVYKAAGAKYGVSWQILYGLHLTETGLRNGPIMNGAGSGAQGPLQFMPGTWGAYGVDGDGDGKADINNAVDAIYGAANYMAKHGTLANGLRSYGGNAPGVLAAAKSKGFSEN